MNSDYSTEGQLDERSLYIVQFIHQRPGCTYNQVSKELEERHLSADMTTLRKIKDLIDNGIVEDRRLGKGFHRLYINEKNEFNRIYRQLMAFQNVVDDSKETLDKVLDLFDKAHLDTNDGETNEDLKRKVFDIYGNYIVPLGSMGNFILHFLLFETFTKVGSENYRRILNDRIVFLMLTTDSLGQEVKRKNFPNNDLKNLNDFLEDKDRRDDYAKLGVNTSTLRPSVNMIDNFIAEYNLKSRTN